MMSFEGLKKLLKKSFTVRSSGSSSENQNLTDTVGRKRREEQTEWVSYYIG